MSKSDGRYRRSIITSNLEKPTSIAVDPEHGLMFWTDAGNNPKIETAWMDGTRRRVIVSTNIGSPEAITVDYAMGHTIYWVDSKLETIGKKKILLRNFSTRSQLTFYFSNPNEI